MYLAEIFCHLVMDKLYKLGHNAEKIEWMENIETMVESEGPFSQESHSTEKCTSAYHVHANN